MKIDFKIEFAVFRSFQAWRRDLGSVASTVAEAEHDAASNRVASIRENGLAAPQHKIFLIVRRAIFRV
jgi:hypothetical protein